MQNYQGVVYTDNNLARIVPINLANYEIVMFDIANKLSFLFSLNKNTCDYQVLDNSITFDEVNKNNNYHKRLIYIRNDEQLTNINAEAFCWFDIVYITKYFAILKNNNYHCQISKDKLKAMYNMVQTIESTIKHG